MSMTANTLQELRAWKAAYAFKLRIYELIDSSPIADDERLQKQLREGAASAVSQISEGFGRFDPADFGRFVKMGRASLVECRNHLIDAVDRGYITEDDRLEYDHLIQEALKEVGGLLDYLQSPEAKRNAERIRQRREERRQRRKRTTNPEQ